MKEERWAIGGAVLAASADLVNAPLPQDSARRSCSHASRAVTRKTMLLMLKPGHFDRIGDGEYRFCLNPECQVVYFTEGEGATFTTGALRVRVGLKVKDAPVPLCYCFGFEEADARAEIALTDQTSIPQRITAFIKQGMCACEERNPSGACCLGEVNKAVKRLMAEHQANSEPKLAPAHERLRAITSQGERNNDAVIQ